MFYLSISYLIEGFFEGVLDVSWYVVTMYPQKQIFYILHRRGITKRLPTLMHEGPKVA